MMTTREVVARAIAEAGDKYAESEDEWLDQVTDAAIAAHLKALAAEGMVVVPREPTEAMREAGNRINSEWTEIEGDAEVQLTGSPMIWRAMIQEVDNG